MLLLKTHGDKYIIGGGRCFSLNVLKDWVLPGVQSPVEESVLHTASAHK